MKLNFKFNATKVDEIEKETGLPIEQAINNTRVSNLALFIQKALVDDNGHHGVTKAVAMDKLDKYLEESDIETLTLDIMEAMVDSGFLSRQFDVEKMRKATNKKNEMVNKTLDETIKAK